MAVPGQVHDPHALRTEDVRVESDGVALDAYLARPAESGTYPGLVLLHEAFGLVEHLRDLARRFAQLGYLAIAPDLYGRIGAPDPDDLSSAVAKMVELEDAQVVRDIDASARLLRDDAECAGRVGVMGFCAGGRQALLAATMHAEVDAAIDCWGGSITRADAENLTTPNRPRRPIDLVDQLHCPLLVVVGADDENPSPEMARELQERAKNAGHDVEVRVFEGAGHAFLADYRPTYREEAAFALWPVLVDFVERNLR